MENSCPLSCGHSAVSDTISCGIFDFDLFSLLSFSCFDGPIFFFPGKVVLEKIGRFGIFEDMVNGAYETDA